MNTFGTGGKRETSRELKGRPPKKKGSGIYHVPEATFRQGGGTKRNPKVLSPAKVRVKWEIRRGRWYNDKKKCEKGAPQKKTSGSALGRGS